MKILFVLFVSFFFLNGCDTLLRKDAEFFLPEECIEDNRSLNHNPRFPSLDPLQKKSNNDAFSRSTDLCKQRPFQGRKPPNHDPTNHDPNIPSSQNLQSNKYGVVKCGNSINPIAFQNNVKAFLSTGIDFNNLGYIGCSAEDEGGVFFKGKVHWKTPFNVNALIGKNEIDISKSSINIYVESNKEKFKPFTLKAVSGVSQDDVLVLIFSDEKGLIKLEGSIEDQKFSGEFKYENFVNWKGERTGYKGVLGEFNIYACDILSCSKNIINGNGI